MGRDDEIKVLFNRMGSQIKEGAPSLESCLPKAAINSRKKKRPSIGFIMSLAASVVILIASMFFWPEERTLDRLENVAVISNWTAPTDVFLSDELGSMGIATWRNPTDILLIDIGHSSMQDNTEVQDDEF